MKDKVFDNKGITLVALVITIIILLILAGISIAQLTGSGLFGNARLSEQKMEQAQKQENDILDQYVNAISNLGSNGDDNQSNEENKRRNFTSLNGSTYFTTNIEQTELSTEFTIAARVYINSGRQQSIAHMDILGGHNNLLGVSWEFEGNTTNLMFNVGGTIAKVDYTPYYDKWTNIVTIFKDGNMKIYLDGIKLMEKSGAAFTPYNKIIIGSSYSGTLAARAMVGHIQSVKIWKTELTEVELNQIDYIADTTIKTSLLLQEMYFDSEQQLDKIGTINGSNYIISTNMGCYAIFSGSTYLTTDIAQEKLIEKQEFTIASRLYINRQQQQNVAYMDILGGHYNTQGISYEFINNTTDLGINISGNIATIDYTPYYDKWIDLVITFKEGALEIYIDGIKIAEKTGLTVVPYGDFIIGTSFTNADRAFKGGMKSVKVWQKALTVNEISNIDYSKETDIQVESILKDIQFDDLNKIKSEGTLYGTGIFVIPEG